MTIEITCSCKSVFTLNENYLNNDAELRCPCCNETFPANTKEDIVKILKTYKNLKDSFSKFSKGLTDSARGTNALSIIISDHRQLNTEQSQIQE